MLASSHNVSDDNVKVAQFSVWQQLQFLLTTRCGHTFNLILIRCQIWCHIEQLVGIWCNVRQRKTQFEYLKKKKKKLWSYFLVLFNRNLRPFWIWVGFGALLGDLERAVLFYSFLFQMPRFGLGFRVLKNRFWAGIESGRIYVYPMWYPEVKDFICRKSTWG